MDKQYELSWNDESTNCRLEVLVNTVSKCKYCNSIDCFDVLEQANSHKVLATFLLFIYKSCGCSNSLMTSYISQNGYEINSRLVYGARFTGKGKCAARILYAVMDLPLPPAKLERFNNSLCQALSSVCSKLMFKSQFKVLYQEMIVFDT